VPALERQPWVLAVLRASNIEPGLSPDDVDSWFWVGIEVAKSERARCLKTRMRSDRG
jgi:hypothetical protein